MNRSHSSSVKSFSSRQKKHNFPNQTAKSEFRTLWKSRNNLIAPDLIKKNLRPILTQINKNTQQLSQQHQTAAQQQMKQFIKMMKKVSNQTTKNKNHSQVSHYKCIQTCQSPGWSEKSIKKPRCQSKTDCLTQNRFVTGLDDLEKKIQSLLQTRLIKKSKSKNFMSQRILDEDVDKQLKILINQVRNYNKKQLKNNNNSSSQICQIGHKIKIIEKAIAESHTQSQILKKLYSSKQKYRKNYAVVDKNSLRRNFSTQILQISESFPTIDMESTNKSSYIAPPQDSYVNKQSKNNSYIVNNQPIARSMYQRQFLNYGPMPTFPQAYRDQGNIMDQKLNHSSFQKRYTSYQVQFKQKRTQLVDSRILDCRRDKFKNLNMSFMTRKDSNIKLNPKGSKLKKVKRKSQANVIETESTKRQNQNSFSQIKKKFQQKGQQKQNYVFFHGKSVKNPILKTQNQPQFKGQKCLLQSQIKQKNLSNLKYGYKFQFQA